MGDVIRFSRRIDLAAFGPALVVARRLGDRLAQARLLRNLAQIESKRGNLIEAEALLRQGRLAASEAGNFRSYAEITKDLGAIALKNTMLEAAELHFEEAIKLATECDSGLIAAQATALLAKVYYSRNDRGGARGHYEAARARFRALGTLPGEPWCIMGLAWLAAEESEYDKATALASEAISLYQTLGLLVDEAACVPAQGLFAARGGAADRAHEMFSKALALFRQAGNLAGQALCERDLKDQIFANNRTLK
jgi:tetratricopeptide (TPR) repeat protein